MGGLKFALPFDHSQWGFCPYLSQGEILRQPVGITTSKKSGGAVQRVRARRVIREAYYAAGVDKTKNVDIVFVARTATTKVKMQKVAQAMHAHLAAAGLLVP